MKWQWRHLSSQIRVWLLPKMATNEFFYTLERRDESWKSIHGHLRVLCKNVNFSIIRNGEKINFSEILIVRYNIDTSDKLENNKIYSASSFSTSNLTSSPNYASGFKFECSSQITQIRVKFTDLDQEHTVFPRMSIPGSLIKIFF